MLNIGVIGLGPIWDTRYAPVLRKYRDRICVRAVYDPIAKRAEQVASQWSAVPVHGVTALLDRKDVRAVLLLDTSWHGLRTLEFARARKKPTYIAARLGGDSEKLHRLYEAARSEGVTLMPEMSRRHAPSTYRLHELMATQLGSPKHIAVEVERQHSAGTNGSVNDDSAELFVSLVDWCRYVARTPILQVEMRTEPVPGNIERPNTALLIQFAPARTLAAATNAELRVRETTASSESAATTSHEPTVRYKIRCERGSATIESPVEISWRTTGETIVESLTSDRQDVEVLIDHFCRRALGGLIPVPDIADVCRGLDVLRAASESLASGVPVNLNGRV